MFDLFLYYFLIVKKNSKPVRKDFKILLKKIFHYPLTTLIILFTLYTISTFKSLIKGPILLIR